MSELPQTVRRRGLFTEAQFAGFLDRIAELTKAEKVERGTREPGKPQVYVNVPDNAIRLAALRLAVELDIGKAPQSLEITIPNAGGKVPTENDALVLLKANPALAQRVLGDYLDVMKTAQNAGKLGACIELPPSTSENELGKRQR